MQPDDFQKELDERSVKSKKALEKRQEQNLSIRQTNAVINTVNQATRTLIDFQKSHQPKVSVTNQKLPKSIKTPDIQAVVQALENLKQPLQDNKPDDTKVIEALGKLNDSISKLPTSFPESPKPVETVTVKNQPDYKPDFDKLGKVLSRIDVKPVVNIPEEKPDDYTPILNSLSAVVEAVQAIKIPKVPTTDLEPLIEATAAVQSSIEALRFPIPNYVLPFKDSNGKATQVQLDASGNVPISGGSGGSGTQYTDGSATITHPIGTIPVYDNAGTITAVSAANPLPVSAVISTAGLATSANQTSEQTLIGAVTETTPTTDTASSGLNGRLQRIAQRLTSLIALLPGSLGQKARAASLAVTLSSEDITALTPSGTTSIAGIVDENLKQVNGVTVNVGTGAAGTGTQRVAVSSDSFPTSQAVTGTFFQTTQPVSAASLPLPTGAATAAIQTTQQSSLTSIDGKLSGALSVTGSTVGTSSAVVNVGQQTSNTTAVQLSASSTIPTNGIIVQAISTNTASVFIGGSGVTTSNGFELQAGQSAPFTSNLNTLYVIGSNASDKVCWDVA